MSTTTSALRTVTLGPPPRRDGPGPEHAGWGRGQASRFGVSRATPSSCPRRESALRAALAEIMAGREVPDFVPSSIADSWQRSLGSGLTPDRIEVPFDPDVNSDCLLVRSARPVLDQLAVDLRGTRVAVLLTNERGQIVDRRVPEPSLLAHLDRILLAPGHVYAEEAVGTNGMGTALAQRAPSAVEGEQHFADALTVVACAGAPIADPRSGRMLGVIDLTCLAAEGSALMLPFATRAAREIEQRLIEDGRVSERLLVQRFLQERRRSKGPIVFLTDRTMLTNAAADRLVEPQDEMLLRGCADNLAGTDPATASSLVLSNGAEVTVRRDSTGDLVVGAVLRLTPTADRSGPRSRAMRGAAGFGWESLTDTERSVVELVATGLTNRQAADRLFLSHHTVGFHLRSIYRKLGVSCRVDLTRIAVEHRTEPALSAAGS